MNITVVGYGSIGARHARILTELGHRTSVVSGRTVDFPVTYPGLGEAVTAERPDGVIISSATNLHFNAIHELACLDYEGIVLVEKPLFDHCHEMPQHRFRQAFVAYNLRFHPVVQRLRFILKGEQVLSVQAYAGQYLPAWRPSSDYRTSCSARREQGGGALRDLSHELDYLIWLFGGWQRVAAIGGHFSPLEINSDDVFAIMMECPLCPAVSLQLNYLDRPGRRSVLVNTAERTIEADLVKGTITINGEVETLATERDQTYRAMHEALLSENVDTLCSMSEGMEVMRLIEAAEMAVAQRRWVER